MIEKLKNRKVDREIIETKKMGKIGAGEILEAVGAVLGVNEEETLSRARNNTCRKMAVYIMKQKSELTLSRIGELFGMDYTAVSQSVNRFDAQLTADEALRQQKDQIIARFAI